MNRTAFIFFGALMTVIFSLAGLVLLPNWQLRGLAPIETEDADGKLVAYPSRLRDYDELPGRGVYIAQGCIYCHSQQVRPATFGADIERGWGERRSVPLDYLHDRPPLMGTMRTGPDLANIGVRQPSEQWHHLHLYDARLVSEGSIMPPMPFLYQVVKKDPKGRGYLLPDDRFGGPAWIVPTQEAHQLVSYLLALRQEHDLAKVMP